MTFLVRSYYDTHKCRPDDWQGVLLASTIKSRRTHFADWCNMYDELSYLFMINTDSTVALLLQAFVAWLFTSFSTLPQKSSSHSSASKLTKEDNPPSPSPQKVNTKLEKGRNTPSPSKKMDQPSLPIPYCNKKPNLVQMAKWNRINKLHSIVEG